MNEQATPQGASRVIHPPLAVGARGRIVLLIGLAFFGGALVALLATGHGSIQPVANSMKRISIWAAVLPSLAAMLLIRAIPPRAAVLTIPFTDQASYRQLRVLLVIASLFPLGCYLLVLAGIDNQVVGGIWALSKPVVFLLLPWLIFRRLSDDAPPMFPIRSGESLWRPQDAWRWVAPIPALVTFACLGLFGPLARPLPSAEDYPDVVVLVVGATLTFFTANIVEELFFRVMLQTRLEAALRQWPGIVATALVFALLHLPTHGQGGSALAGLPLTLGAIVVYQGVFALFVGYLWSRYRNVWMLIVAHSVINTLPLLLM